MLIFLKISLILIIYICFWYILSLIKKRNDIADIAWGLGFILIAWSSFYYNEFNLISLFVNILITIWGLRLSIHIYLRNKNKEEDYRYKKWREEWKFFYIRSFLQVFLLQGILMFIISIPVILINNEAIRISSNFYLIGILIWCFGFIFESISDWQLKTFISNKENQGKIMKTGLWKYSRHPNYFGEITMWWGVFIISFFVTKNIYAILSPLTITYLIIYVSGIPLLENKYKDNVEYINYKNKTNKLIPWFSK